MQSSRVSVLCIHGRPGNSKLMVPFHSWCVKRSYQFISYDQFACRSDVDFSGDLGAVYDLLVAELHEVIEGISCEQLLIVAHSFGGALLCEVLSKSSFLKGPVKVVFSGFCPDREEYLVTNQGRLQKYTFLLGQSLGERYFSDNHICDLKLLTTAQRCAFIEKPFGDLKLRDSYSDLLGALDFPVLFTYGDKDICTDHQASVASRRLRNCSVFKFASAAHYPFIEQPDSYFKAMDFFMAIPWSNVKLPNL